MNLDDMYVSELYANSFKLVWDNVIYEMIIRLPDFSIVDNEYVDAGLRKYIYPVDHLPPDIYKVVTNRNILKNALIEYLDMEIETVQEDVIDEQARYEKEMAKWKASLDQSNAKLSELQKLRNDL